MLDSLYVHAFTEAYDPVSLNLTVDDMVLGTRYEGKWQINRPARSGWLNIYLIDSQAPRLNHDRALSGNAVYIADKTAVIVDRALIENIAGRYYGVYDWGERATMMYWIMGHEIGHAMCGHGTAHFTNDPLLGPTNRATGIQAKELEADEYFASVLLRRARSENRGNGYEVVLLRILQTEMRTLHARHDKHRWTLWRVQPTHPEYVERAVHLLDLLAVGEANGALEDSVQLYRHRLADIE